MSASPTFPQLSRKPALKTREQTLDPTLRDSMDNGMETTRAKFTRRRRTFSVSIDYLTPDDKITVDLFVETTVNYGALPFFFADARNPASPQSYFVRFSTIPTFSDAGWVDGYFRQNCTFELREV